MRSLLAGHALATLGCVIGIGLPAGSAGSSEPERGPADRVRQHLLESPRLVTGALDSRLGLSDYGVGLQLYYNNSFGAKLSGGTTPESTHRNSGSYDLLSLVDFEELANLRGLELLLHVKGNHGKNVNPDVGAISDPIDDADGDRPIYVAQLWGQHVSFAERVRLRVGYLDQQTVLDRNAFANNEDRQFMATALDNNPLVPLKIGLGVTLLASPASWLTFTLGTADADNVVGRAGFDTFFDDAASLMFYGEVGLRFELAGPNGPLPGNYRVGAFRDGSARPVVGSDDPLGQTVRRGSPGVYLSFDQLVLRERPGSAEGLGAFARFGWVDPEVNPMTLFWSVGLTYRGPLPGRGRDRVGLGVYQLRPSDRAPDALDAELHAETGLELYYRLLVLPWLEMTPDIQYIHAPGGRESSDDAVVVALRTRVTF